MKNKKMSPLATDILAGLNDVLTYVSGKPVKRAIAHTVRVPDIKAIRKNLNMSQSAFASAYNIPLATLKGWEQHRRRLDTTAIAYLRTIARFPQEVRLAQQTRTRTTTARMRTEAQVESSL